MGFLLFCLSTRGPAAPLVVVLPKNPSPAEVHAKGELINGLTQMGVKRLTLGGRTVTVDLGLTPSARRACSDLNWKKFGVDEFVIRTVPGHLIIAGASPRGTLNGVHRFLGGLGVRWWTPWAATYPAQPASLPLSKTSVRESPALEYRDPYWHGAFNTEWSSRNLCNGWNEGLTEKHGGGTVYEGFVHTFNSLVDPATQFPVHPEWFSLINDKRTTESAQLCTTNLELRKYILEQVRRRLRANPKATIVSVSQNDCFNQCQCGVCQALAKEEGSQSAPLVALANYVADGIKAEFPNVAVDTLAYQWSRHAPKTLKPRPNVIVRLCSIECDFGTPLDRGRNQDFASDIRDWTRLTHRLYIWDYVTNFRHYMQPMPDYMTIGPNIRFFAANGGRGLFEEGDYNSEGGDMAELKCWLQAQLLWNPKQDDRKLMAEFLRGYYGPGAVRWIGGYLDLMAKAAAASPVSVFDRSDKQYLTYPILHEADLYWRSAESQASLNPTFLARIKRSHLGVQYVWLSRWDEFRAAALAAADPWLFPESREVAAQEWLSTATSPLPDGTPPVTAVNEGGTSPAAWVAALGKG